MRSHGQGTMRERRPGVWQLRIRHQGRYVTRTVNARNEAAADLELARLRLEVADGKHDLVEGLTLGELVERWLAFSGPHLSPTTMRGYRRLVTAYLKPAAIWTMPCDKVKGRDLDALYTHLSAMGGAKGGPLSPRTVNQVHFFLSGVYRQAAAWEITTNAPTRAAKRRKAAAHQIDPPSAEEIRKALDTLKGRPTLYLFAWLAAVTGCRRGELVALQWGDFDLDAGVLVVSRAAIHDEDGAVIVKGTKTNQVRRMSIDAPTVELLRAHRERQAEHARPGPRSYLFSTSADLSTPWRPNHATLMWCRTRDAAGLKRVRLHDLRHSMVTRLLSEGVDVRTVSGRAGHSQTSTTLNQYAHFVPARDVEAAGMLSAGLAGERSEGPDEDLIEPAAV